MDNNTMGKAAALRAARKRITLTRMGRGWTIYQPYQWDKPHGPSTGGHEMAWPVAQAAYTEAVALGALRLMGWYADDAAEAINSAICLGFTGADEIVSLAINK